MAGAGFPTGVRRVPGPGDGVRAHLGWSAVEGPGAAYRLAQRSSLRAWSLCAASRQPSQAIETRQPSPSKTPGCTGRHSGWQLWRSGRNWPETLHDRCHRCVRCRPGARTASELLDRAALAPELKATLAEPLDYVLPWLKRNWPDASPDLELLPRFWTARGWSWPSPASGSPGNPESWRFIPSSSEPILPLRKEALYRIAQGIAEQHGQARSGQEGQDWVGHQPRRNHTQAGRQRSGIRPPGRILRSHGANSCEKAVSDWGQPGNRERGRARSGG